MENFTPIASLIGGLLIGAASALMLLASGRIAGVSGIAGAILDRVEGDTSWRVFFVLGLALSGILALRLSPERLAFGIDRSAGALVVAGLLVGLGTRISNGCTSGHGVCGIGRGSPRSIAATGVFMGTAAVGVHIINQLFGGSI